MKKAAKIGGLVALAIAMFGAYGYLTAQSKHSQAGKTLSTPPVFSVLPSEAAPALATNHALVRNYYTAGTLGGVEISAHVFTPVDTIQTVQCPGTSGNCTIIADHWLEVRNPLGGARSGNGVDGCLYVDGVGDGHCGLIDDEAPPDGSWAQATSSHHTSGVGLGNHTVQTFIFCNSGCDLAYFHVNYRVYKP